MPEGPVPASIAAVTAWLAAPTDPARLAALGQAGMVVASTFDRLPVRALSALQATDAPRFRFREPKAAVRAALLVCDLGARCEQPPLADEQRDLDQLPFVVRFADGEVIAELSGSPERRNCFGQPLFHQWAGGIAADAVAVDCHRLDHINSVMIAWLLQLAQASKPARLHIRRAKQQVATQLKQLRLDHLMQIG
jgi:hypothetical protein